MRSDLIHWEKLNQIQIFDFYTIYFKLIIKKQGFNSSCKVNLNLILPLILFLLDGVDEIPPLINLGYKNKKRACKTFRYQSLDKINDLLSYILTCIIFRLDKYFIFFIMIRTIGVSLFLKYRKVRYLILFPDFMKEYLLYRYFFLCVTNN